MAMSRQKETHKMDIIELKARNQPSLISNQLVRLSSAKDFRLQTVPTKPLNPHWTQSKARHYWANGGIGKQPSLKFSLGIIPIAGAVERGDYLELGYFEQEVEGGTPDEAVWNAFPALNQAEVRAAFARCGLVN